MRAQYISQCFELDRIPEGFATILTQATRTDVSWNRGKSTAKTPRIDIFFTAQTNEGRRYLTNSGNAWSGAQYYDTWNARFEVDVVTNRKTNPAENRKLIGLVRFNFQTGTLIDTWTELVSPYHSITSMIEAAEQCETDNEDNTDTTRLVFEGLVNVRADAWPITAPIYPGVPELFNLANDETFLLCDGENFLLAS